MSGKYIKDLFSYIFSSFLVGIIGFAVTPVLTWIIVPAELGNAGLFIAMAVFASAIGPFGLDQSYMRYVSFHEPESEGSLWPAMALRSLIQTTLPAFAGIMLDWVFHRSANSILHSPGLSVLFLLLCYMMVLERFVLLRLRMLQKASGYGKAIVVKGAVNSVLSLLFCWIHPFYSSLIFAQLAASFICILFTVQYAGWNSWFHNGIISALRGRVISKEMIRFALPFGLTVILTLLTEQSDRFIISELVGVAQLGIYLLALKTVAALTFVTSSFQTFWYPFSYKLSAEDPDANMFFNRALTVFSAIAIPAVAVFGLCIPLMKFIFGPPYREAVYIAPILALVPVLLAGSEIFSTGINLAKKSHFHIPVTLISAICFLFLAWILGKIDGIRGVAAALALASMAFLLARAYFSSKTQYGTFMMKRHISPLVLVFIIAGMQSLKMNLAAIATFILILIPTLCFSYCLIYKEMGLKVLSKISNKKTVHKNESKSIV